MSITFSGMTVSGGVTITLTPLVENWANSTTDPIVGWTDPTDSAKQIFAIPANSVSDVTGTWQYSLDQVSWTNFGLGGGLFVSVSGGIVFNGTSYNGFYRSTQWTKGNPTYYQRIASNIFGTKVTRETTAATNLKFTGPYN